jgi:hypothetical protein
MRQTDRSRLYGQRKVIRRVVDEGIISHTTEQLVIAKKQLAVVDKQIADWEKVYQDFLLWG